LRAVGCCYYSSSTAAAAAACLTKEATRASVGLAIVCAGTMVERYYSPQKAQSAKGPGEGLEHPLSGDMRSL